VTPVLKIGLKRSFTFLAKIIGEKNSLNRNLWIFVSQNVNQKCHSSFQEGRLRRTLNQIFTIAL